MGFEAGQNGVVVYKGQFMKSECHGRGRITFPDGETYVGQWQNNMRHGQGTNVGANGVVDYSRRCQRPTQLTPSAAELGGFRRD